MDNSKMEEWFNSEEGKKTIEKFVKEQQEEKIQAKKAEEKSKLKYPNGEKVKRGDLFIDLKEKEKCDSDPSHQSFGYHMYVYRINEDESVDVCINANFALKLNDFHFDFNDAELVKRDAKLYSPLDDLIEDNE